MPSLEQIYLSTDDDIKDNNLIAYVDDFRKESFPKLIALAVNGQKVKDGSSLFRIQSDCLKNLFLEYEEGDEQSCFDMRWVMKLRSCKLAKLCN